MRIQRALTALVMAAVLCLATASASAQVIITSPGVVTYQAPVIVPAPVVVPPIVPYYATGYSVVVPRPWVGVSSFSYGPGWGYTRGYVGVRQVFPGYTYRYRYGRWW